MRLAILFTALLGWLAPPDATGEAPSPGPSADAEPDPEHDILGELVVEAKRRGPLVLPKLAVLTPDDGGGSFLHDLLERDLELSGEFDVVALDHWMDFDDAFDNEPFVRLGVEIVITAAARERDDGQIELAARLYLPKVGELPAWSSSATTELGERRLAGHRLADDIIGVLTGTDGPFASRLILVRTEGSSRRAYLIDPDGENLTPISPADQLVVTAALDRSAHPYWAASERNGAYRLYREGQREPLVIEPSGSIYGIAFAPNGTDVGLSIANEDGIEVYVGPLGGRMTAHSNVDFALSPSFVANDRVVYAGSRGSRRRIYIGAKSISPKEISASSPTVCQHPDGRRLVYAVGLAKNTDLVAAKLDGSDMSRLTWGSARNFAPACSPDGRLVAFFSTRTSGDGPGLYLMRVDGHRPKQISTALGDVLAWARFPLPP